MKQPILVWSFYDAPEELRSLSEHGGDEEWIVAIPVEGYSEGELQRLEWSIAARIDRWDSADGGFCEVEYNGQLHRVYISAHA